MQHEHEMYEELFTMLPQGIIVWRLVQKDDPSSLTCVVANPAAEALLGIDGQLVRGKTMGECFPEAMASGRLEAYADVALSRSPRQLKMIELGQRTLSVWAFPLRDHCVAIAFEDVTARVGMDRAARQQQVFLDSIVENIPDMIFVKDAAELRFIRFNKAGEELLGHPRENLIGKNDYDFFPREQADFFIAADREVLANGKLLDVPEEPIETKMRGSRILHTKKIPLLDEHGRPQFLLGISQDITESKHAREALERQAEELRTLSLVDELTGLYNRRGFLTLAQQQLKIADRRRRSVVLFFLDLDGMKRINDEHGHAAGDSALIDTARLLKESFRESDIVARLGGDEFAVLATDVGTDNAGTVQARLHSAVARDNAALARPYTLSISMGATVYNPARPCGIERLLEEADAVMYASKRSSRKPLAP